MNGLIRQTLIFTFCSFVLHSIWEIIQCSPFFVHLAAPPSIHGMIQATAGDVALTMAAFGLTWLVTQDQNWITTRWRLSTWATLIGSALFFSIIIEIFALKSSRWNYTDLNPVIPYLKISILPVAQLVILFPVSFWMTRKFLCSRHQ